MTLYVAFIMGVSFSPNSMNTNHNLAPVDWAYKSFRQHGHNGNRYCHDCHYGTRCRRVWTIRTTANHGVPFPLTPTLALAHYPVQLRTARRNSGASIRICIHGASMRQTRIATRQSSSAAPPDRVMAFPSAVVRTIVSHCNVVGAIITRCGVV